MRLVDCLERAHPRLWDSLSDNLKRQLHSPRDEMLILAIEQSSDKSSVAVLKNEKVLAEREWDSLASRSCGLFACLKDLLAAVALNLKDISQFVLDVGPGSYSGLRSSFAAVRAFALPGKQPIYALTSAEALAFEIMQEFPLAQVQVVGDARRKKLWTCLYKKDGQVPFALSKIQLVSENNFRAVSGAVLVSSDWHRLKDTLQAVPGLRGRLIEELRVPKAGYLGKLAYLKMQMDIPGESLCPVYLHPAVEGVQRNAKNIPV